MHVLGHPFFIPSSSRHLPYLLVVFILIPDLQVGAQAFQSNIDAWVAQDAIDTPSADALLFVGSSSIRFWERLAQDFSDYDVIQRGFGGSQFSHLNGYVDDIVLPYNPAAIVVFEGTNDVFAGKSADTVFQDYLAFVDLVHSGQDQLRDPIPILYIGITPTPARWTCCRTASSAVNSLIEQHAQSDSSLYYVDTPSQFLATSSAPDQPPSQALFIPDGLHLNQDGYDIWTANVRPVVQTVVTSPKTYRTNPLHPSDGSRLLIDFGPNSPASRDYLTLGTDENSNTWNNWLPADQDNVSDRILAGRHLGNLVTSSGDEAGIGIVITGEFEVRNSGGLQNPDGLLLGEFAVESVTKDYFFSDDTYTPGGLMVTGLDVDATYEFRFFASRRSNGMLTTEYVVTGESVQKAELQTSGRDIGHDGAYDGNDDEIATVVGVRPDEFGQIFVAIEPLNGSQAFLAAMEISVMGTFEPLGDCNGDGVLNAADLSCVSSVEARDSVLAALNTLPGDLDGNGDVNFGDFLVLSRNFGQNLSSYMDGNIDLTNGVAFADFLVLSVNFGRTPDDGAAVPEPNGSAVFWLGLLIVAAFRRNRRR